MNFYTNVSRYGNRILYRGIENGKKKIRSIPYKPTIFISSPKGSWRGLDGTPVEPIQKQNMWDDQESFTQSIAGQKQYGNARFRDPLHRLP